MKIIVPTGIVYEDSRVLSLIAIGAVGQLEILPGHTDFLTPLRISHLEVRTGRQHHRSAIHWSVASGILQVSREGVVIISPAAELSEKIDVDRARQSRERARHRLSRRESKIDTNRALQALERAEVRLKVASFNRNSSEG